MELPPEMADCQIVTLLHSFLFLIVGSAPEPLNTRVNCCFVVQMAAARQVLACRCSQRPTKLRIFFGISSLPPCFFEVRESWREGFLNLLTKVKCKEG